MFVAVVQCRAVQVWACDVNGCVQPAHVCAAPVFRLLYVLSCVAVRVPCYVVAGGRAVPTLCVCVQAQSMLQLCSVWAA